MVSLDDGSPNKSTQQRVTFGVSKLWIPHVALVYFIYYVLLSPQHHADQNAFWTLGTSVYVLVGGKMVNVAVTFMWIIHVLEAAYTIILARRYETTIVVGLSYVLAALLFRRPGWEELSNRARESSTRSKVA
ncbi:hypothetical protein BDM02DRAFT_3182588 [Thelephora ganbajun]|uniref:Uncharacterized protein n=1 Tax=Thelephora ganbajun TaxID=370292 RepID=A0ACB6ZVF2_THEGA|nr:hypothetical protein BDM02DRAFT_3182588 [Thelephora ganbajun]